ncbi:MAG TPA: RNA polymerase sigma-70 factor [Chitinophaga sp.]|uniref:RNA polymerase sigma-70 factor n=1 Tax=Chitinophaga sp. TaxID=1869181 RepID=UPI002C1978B5|nr:RNA polymerase sigma-70 factor [Chitinophaga sp.]HVI48456.1 RNA polymerase sigma-70 factor [Chitinophaga sp.]
MQSKTSLTTPAPSRDMLEFKELFDSRFAALCLFAGKLTGCRKAAEDLVQETFIRYWERREFYTPSTAQAFLYKTVRNLCLDWLKHQEVRKRYLFRSSHVMEESSIIIDRIIQVEVLRQLKDAIDSLPHRCREVITLSLKEGLKNHEIAAQLGVSVNTVKTQKQRALQLLRFRLDLGDID